MFQFFKLLLTYESIEVSDLQRIVTVINWLCNKLLITVAKFCLRLLRLYPWICEFSAPSSGEFTIPLYKKKVVTQLMRIGFQSF